MISRIKDYVNYRKSIRALYFTPHGSLYKRSLWWFILLSPEQRLKREEEEIRELEAIISRAR